MTESELAATYQYLRQASRYGTVQYIAKEISADAAEKIPRASTCSAEDFQLTAQQPLVVRSL